MKKVNIGGVPEHFNLAWYLTLRNGEYKDIIIISDGKNNMEGLGKCAKPLGKKKKIIL